MELYVRELLGAAREELVRADNKASILLAGVGITVGATLSGLLSKSWAPFLLDNRVEWLWWLGTLSIVAAIYRLGSAVYPRTVRKGPAPSVVAYFGDVNGYAGRPANDLRTALRHSSSQSEDQLVDQLRQVSRIVKVKYQCIRDALVTFGAGVVVCGIAVLINGAIS